jgi:RNA polymerase sigma factor (TIGR02999 family)
MDGRTPDVTTLLREVKNGKRELEPQLYDLVYQELRRYAGNVFRGRQDAGHHTPTSLVHEAYIRMVAYADRTWATREDFYRYAGRVMRNVLVDEARGKMADKRGGGQVRQLLDGEETADKEQRNYEEILQVDAALQELQRLSARQAEIVTLLHFGGLTVSEAAEALGVSKSTIEREWKAARAWLYRKLQ